MPASTIRFLVFDMDEVIYDYDHGQRLRLLEELTGRPAADIDRDVWGGPHEHLAEAGTPDTAEAYLEQYSALLGHPVHLELFADIRRQMMRPRPDVFDLLHRVRPGVDLALLTNNGMALKAALPVCAPEVLAVFKERSHVSAEFGRRKPDPEVYRAICSRYGHRPEETAFIDDKQENVDGAISAGLMAHRYETAIGLEAFLGTLGVLSGKL